MPEAEFLEALRLLLCLGREHHAVAAVHFAHNLVELLLEAVAVLVGKAEVVVRLVLAETHDLACERLAAFAALRPDFGKHDIDAELLALVRDAGKLLLGVKREAVDCDHGRKAEDLRHVLDMLQKVRKALFQCLDIRRVELCLVHTAVVLQRAHGCDHDRAIRAQTRHAALDINELLCAEIGTETRLRDRVVVQAECQSGREHGVAAVRNVCERSAVNEGRRVL